MKYLNIKYVLALIVLGGFIATSCTDSNPVATESEEAEISSMDMAFSVAGNEYDEVLALEYYPTQNYHVLSVKNTSTGTIDTYIGDDKNWTKIPNKQDADNAQGPFEGMSVGENGDFVYAFLHNGRVAVQSGREFYNKPWFDKGRKVIKDGDGNSYDKVLALEFYPTQNYHVLSVKNTSTGTIDTYIGDNKNWTKIPNKQDAGNAQGPFEGMSVGENGDFVYAFLHNGRVAVQSGREFSNKPWFDKGRKVIKDGDGNSYDKVLALEFYPTQNYHVLSVKNTTTGARDTYIGDNKNWTKIPNKQDAGNAWGAFQAMSVGEDGDFVYAYLHNGRVAVQSGREFYNKPWFDKGKYIIRDN